MRKALVFLIAVLPLTVSCKIDRDYDLDRPVDTHMVLAKNLAIPLGDLGSLSTETLMILLGSDYISFNEDGNVVLDFTENPELVFQYDLTGLKMKNRIELDAPFGLQLDMDISNTSPFSFKVEAVIIDSLGAVVKGYRPIIKGGVESGAPGQPSISDLSISATADDIIPFDGVRFNFHFGGGDLAGQKYVVTKDENLTIKTMSLSLPEGVPISPEWIAIANPLIKFVKLFTAKGNKDEGK